MASTRTSRFGDRYGRTDRMKAAGYTHVLHFRREFTRGTFEGATHNDVLPFVTERDAHDWVNAANAAHARGKLDYRVISHDVEAL